MRGDVVLSFGAGELDEGFEFFGGIKWYDTTLFALLINQSSHGGD
jgi:hypothetical protein